MASLFLCIVCVYETLFSTCFYDTSRIYVLALADWQVKGKKLWKCLRQNPISKLKTLFFSKYHLMQRPSHWNPIQEVLQGKSDWKPEHFKWNTENIDWQADNIKWKPETIGWKFKNTEREYMNSGRLNASLWIFNKYQESLTKKKIIFSLNLKTLRHWIKWILSLKKQKILNEVLGILK